jgi:hypothetical protein
MNTSALGSFPFGRPSTVRPPRRPDGDAAVFVLGVYPSALHVRWSGPSGDGKAARVGALAVDNEPTCFWNGADQRERIAAWKTAVGFPDDGSWGSVAPATANGSSGQLVDTEVLAPLQLSADDAWLTDSVPWFFVKYGGKRREQGDAIRESFDPFAASVPGLGPASLPARPTPAALVKLATTTQRDRLRSELLESGAKVVLTLGQEASDTLCGVTDDPQPAGVRLDRNAYGRPGRVKVGSAEFEWLALAHPGVTRRKGPWRDAHLAWCEERRGR